jgi:hypothetical protein
MVPWDDASHIAQAIQAAMVAALRWAADSHAILHSSTGEAVAISNWLREAADALEKK